MNTLIRKDWAKQWKAETTIDLADNRLLRITTRKANNGNLHTSAHVGTQDGVMVTYAHGDYYKLLVSTNPARITEKVITKQHNDFLAESLDDLLVVVEQFYQKELA